jgi:hypothetical protein
MYIPVLLSVAIVDESELIGVCYRWCVDQFLFFFVVADVSTVSMATEIRGFVHLCLVP